MSRRALLGMALGLGLALATVQTAAADQRIELDPSSGPCRALITVRGSGFPPGESVTVFAREGSDDAAELGRVHRVAPDGSFEFEAPAVTLRPDCQPGDEMPVFARIGDNERIVVSLATATYTAVGPTPPASGSDGLVASSARVSVVASLAPAIMVAFLVVGRCAAGRTIGWRTH